MKKPEFPCNNGNSKLGWGLKKWVLTRPDIWHIENLFWDKGVNGWYVRAKSLVEENNYVEFHVTSSYFKKVTNGIKPYTLVD